jgi:ParB-like chromosome segregation protein Spo0J
VAKHRFYGAVVAQRSTGAILAGNHRWDAARSEGLEKSPAVWVDVSDTVAKQLLLSDNKISDLARYADDALATVFLDLRGQNALEGSGYNEADLGDLLKSMGNAIREASAKTVVEVEEAQLPELPQTPISQRGNKWNLDGHWLVCGDATTRQDVLQLMVGAKAQCVFTDPPYNCSVHG